MRRLLPVLLCLAVAPVLSGCGSDDVKDLAGGDVAKAAERTAAQKTARMTMTMQIGGMGLPAKLSLGASGVMDLTRPRGSIAIDLPEGVPGEVKLLVDGNKLYAQLPEAMTSFTSGKRWVSLDLAGIAKQLGFDVEGLSGAMNPSPSAQLELLRSVKGFEEVEERHFKGTFTLRELMASLPAEAQAAMKKLESLAGKSVLDEKQTAELWLDENGLARQWRSELAMGKGATAKIDFKLSDFGTPLKLDPPSADETFEFTEDSLMGLLSGALLGA